MMRIDQVAGKEEEQTPVWQLLYAASTDLGLTGVGPDDWMEVIMMMIVMLVRICWEDIMHQFLLVIALLISYQVLTRAATDYFLFEQMVTFYNQNRTTGSLPAQLPKKGLDNLYT